MKSWIARSAVVVAVIVATTVAGVWFPTSASADVVSDATSWARGQIGSTGYYDECLAFVHDAYSIGAGVDIGSAASAVAYWNAHASTHHSDASPPAGALVFWGATTTPIVNPDGHVALAEGNGNVISSYERSTTTIHEFAISARTNAGYPYLGWLMPSNVSAYIGHIVKWPNPGGQTTSWIVSSDGKRYWIPDTSTYYCAVGVGFSDLGTQSSTVLDGLPDSGQTWHCPVNPRGAQDTLAPGQGLYEGQTITSLDNRFTLILQGDGNLVEYGPGRVVWATNVWTGGYLILQQGDCNLVGYNQWGAAKWATNHTGSGCALVVQNDGNLVEYGNGGVIWATNQH